MPNCFQLFPKGSAEAADLHKVDEEICAHFGAPVDPVNWYANWYNIIGWDVAFGRPLGSAELRERTAKLDPGGPLVDVLKFLEERYTSDAWAEVGRRAGA